MVTLVIDGTLSNLNDYTKACRSNKYAGAKMKEENEEIVTWYIKAQIKEHFDDPIRLAFRWYEPNRKRDLDNICFAKKFILDALVKCGVIDNDNWQHIEGFTDNFFIDKGRPRIEVDIESVKR